METVKPAKTRKPRPKTPGRVVPVDQKLTAAGRPRKEPPAGAVDIIRDAAARGASKMGIAMALGANVTVLARWLDEHPEFQEALDHGREKERHVLHTVLYDAAVKGNIVAAMFILKCKFGWREGDQAEQGNRVSINFQLPGALTPEQYFVKQTNERPTASLSLPRPSIERS